MKNRRRRVQWGWGGSTRRGVRGSSGVRLLIRRVDGEGVGRLDVGSGLPERGGGGVYTQIGVSL